jgi:cytochrome P450
MRCITGYETTANAVTWSLFSLSQNPDMQARLRAELLEAFPDDSMEPTVEALNALPYLEAIVRETLRFHPPIDLTARVAEGDDVIPLNHEYIGKDGKPRKHIEWVLVHRPDTVCLKDWC